MFDPEFAYLASVYACEDVASDAALRRAVKHARPAVGRQRPRTWPSLTTAYLALVLVISAAVVLLSATQPARSAAPKPAPGERSTVACSPDGSTRCLHQIESATRRMRDSWRVRIGMRRPLWP